MEDLKKFEEKNKESIFQALGNGLRVGLEDLMHTIGVGSKKENSSKSEKQITTDMDKYENKMINGRK